MLGNTLHKVCKFAYCTFHICIETLIIDVDGSHLQLVNYFKNLAMVLITVG